MRRHDQTRGRGRLRPCAWWVLVALVAPGAALAYQEPAELTSPAVETLDLSADRIRVWTAGGQQWALLDGHAAVLQGVDGLRAERAVVKVTTQSNLGKVVHTAEVYAEGKVQATDRPGQSSSLLRATLTTYPGVKFKPYSAKGLERTEGPPPDSLALVRRAFPPPIAPNLAAAPAPNDPAPRARAPLKLFTPVTTGRPDGASRQDASHTRADFAPTQPLSGPAPTGATNLQNGTPAAVAGVTARPPAPANPPPELPSAPPALATSAAPSIGTAPAPATSPLADVATPPAPVYLRPTAALSSAMPPPANAVDQAANTAASQPAKTDTAIRRAQLGEEGFPEMPGGSVDEPAEEQPAAEEPGQPPVLGPSGVGDLEPLPPGDILPPPEEAPAATAPAIPMLPYSQRSVSIFARDAGPNFKIQTLDQTKEGVTTVVVQGGVNIVVEDRPGALEPEKRGTVDLSADNAVIWKGPAPAGAAERLTPNGEDVVDGRQPLEVYLEGNVVFRQDQRLVAGNGDQKTYRATRAYYDFRTERFIALDAEMNMFSPALIAPMKMTGPQIQQFAPLATLPDGRTVLGKMHIYSDHAMMTGSRFPNPGYKFTSRSIDMEEITKPLTDPRTGKPVGRPGDPNPPQDKSWIIDARQNLFFMGPIPVFYWPRVLMDPDDFDPPLRNITPRTNNYFGQQLLTDWNGFKLFGLQKPKFVQTDNWNVDIDYLSRRKSAALGTEIGYFGADLFSDIYDEFSPDKNDRNFKRSDIFPTIRGGYNGYLDFWGLQDHATDVLGTGPAIITNGPAGAGKAGFQRFNAPSFENFRGRVMWRHMQQLLGDDAGEDEDFRLSLEAGFISDRYFLEQYYQRLFDTGMDQETAAYLIRQHQNTAWTIQAEGNLQNWYTDTQWLPKFDYYRLGDPLLNNVFSYYTNSGVDWANTHTASEVNNPNLFAFLPYDPVSNTSGPLRTGRIYTNHELDLPVDLDFVRIVPYVQGQLVGWNNQIGGEMLGRAWGAAGARANIMLWKRYPNVQSELFNLHGLNHKITFDADYRDAFSNVALNRIGVQDDLDENNYESVRRYFAMTNYAGGILPMQYDPRFLTLRRGISPITGTTDVQAAIQMLQLGIHQRLQTKRGPEGKRRIIDYMVLDVTTTYFPNANRDNFGKSFGQNMYNWEWYVGDRTSLYSYGWFEFFDINGQALLQTDPRRHNDPFGITVVSSGISISRPPRGNITFGYSIINTGTISTSALNVSYSYWLSPKWYGAFVTSYDFGNAILLGSSFAITRIGSDYLTTVGLSVDPQRLNSFTFGFEIAPRLSPNIRLGSTAGLFRFDSRFAPTQ